MLKQASGGERTSATAEPGQATNEGAASIGRRSSFSMPAGYWQHYGVSPAPHLVSPIARKQDTSATDPSEGVSATETFARATSGASGEVPFRADMEQAFGEKFSTVRSFVGQDGPMRDISAKAATQGERIAFASSSPDKRLVAHELAHVAQNRHGSKR